MEKSKCSIPTNDDNVDEDVVENVIDNVDEEMIENVDDEMMENAKKFGGGFANVRFPWKKIWVLDWISPILKFVQYLGWLIPSLRSCKKIAKIRTCSTENGSL